MRDECEVMKKRRMTTAIMRSDEEEALMFDCAPLEGRGGAELQLTDWRPETTRSREVSSDWPATVDLHGKHNAGHHVRRP